MFHRRSMLALCLLATAASASAQGEPYPTRAITLVEDESRAGADLVRQLYADTGRAQYIGITGPPGAGKSTLVDRLIAAIRKTGKSVGVMAIACACRRTPETRASSSAAWPRAGTLAAWRDRPPTWR